MPVTFVVFLPAPFNLILSRLGLIGARGGIHCSVCNFYQKKKNYQSINNLTLSKNQIVLK